MAIICIHTHIFIIIIVVVSLVLLHLIRNSSNDAYMYRTQDIGTYTHKQAAKKIMKWNER